MLNVLDPRLSKSIHDIGWWARVLAVLGFVSILGAAAFFGFVLQAVQPAMSADTLLADTDALSFIATALVLLVYFGLGAYLCYRLFIAGATLLNSANRGVGNEGLAAGFRALKAVLKLGVWLHLVLLVLVAGVTASEVVG